MYQTTVHLKKIMRVMRENANVSVLPSAAVITGDVNADESLLGEEARGAVLVDGPC